MSKSAKTKTILYFNYEKPAKEAGLTGGELRQIKRLLRPEAPYDMRQFELAVLRAVLAIRDGKRTLAQTLQGPRQSQ
jgi:hypothetical protein